MQSPWIVAVIFFVALVAFSVLFFRTGQELHHSQDRLGYENTAADSLKMKVSLQSVELCRLQSVILGIRAQDARMNRTCHGLRVQIGDLCAELMRLKRMAAMTTVDARYEAMEKGYDQREQELRKQVRDLEARIMRLCGPARDKGGKFAKRR